LTYPVPRAERITVRGLDADGQAVSLEAEEFEARVIQHEVDHLDGVLFLDRLGPAERREAMRTLREQALDLTGVGLYRARTPTTSM
jgi:peptide deformylase